MWFRGPVKLDDLEKRKRVQKGEGALQLIWQSQESTAMTTVGGIQQESAGCCLTFYGKESEKRDNSGNRIQIPFQIESPARLEPPCQATGWGNIVWATRQGCHYLSEFPSMYWNCEPRITYVCWQSRRASQGSLCPNLKMQPTNPSS